MSYVLPIFCAAVVAIAVTTYALLDGMNLGVGAMLLFVPNERSRDVMVSSIAS